VAPPELHWQVLHSPVYDGSLSGECRAPRSHMAPLPMDSRKAIAHRAFFFIRQPHSVVNLGVGMPEARAESRPCRAFLQ
jgi:propionate CoA-transferase